MKQFVDVYERQYLHSETVIEPFTRLNLEILNLLDPKVPGLKPVLDVLRWAGRWQTKLIWRIGKRLFSKKREKLPPELVAYADAHIFALNELTSFIDRAKNSPRHHPFWDALGMAWESGLDSLSERFAELVQEHMADTDREIKRAATEVYAKLKESRALLGVLQTVKVSSRRRCGRWVSRPDQGRAGLRHSGGRCACAIAAPRRGEGDSQRG